MCRRHTGTAISCRQVEKQEAVGRGRGCFRALCDQARPTRQKGAGMEGARKGRVTNAKPKQTGRRQPEKRCSGIQAVEIYGRSNPNAWQVLRETRIEPSSSEAARAPGSLCLCLCLCCASCAVLCSVALCRAVSEERGSRTVGRPGKLMLASVEQDVGAAQPGRGNMAACRGKQTVG